MFHREKIMVVALVSNDICFTQMTNCHYILQLHSGDLDWSTVYAVNSLVFVSNFYGLYIVHVVLK